MKPKEVSLNAKDLEYIRDKLATIVEAVLVGDELKKKIVNLKLEVPKELYDIFQRIADRTGKSTKHSIGEAATQGINEYLKNLVKVGGAEEAPAPKVPKIEGMEQLMKSFNIEGLTDGLNQMKTLADRLESIQKVFTNAADTPEPDKSNSNSTENN